MAMTADSSQTCRAEMSIANGNIKTHSHKSSVPPLHTQAIVSEESKSDTPPVTEMAATTADDESKTENLIACNGNAAWTKKAAWNTPSVAVDEAVSPVMGEQDFWPALNESVKASPKSTETSKLASNGSLRSPKGGVVAQSPHKQTATNAKSHSTTNHTMPTRQRPHKRGSGGGGGSGGGSSGGREQNNPNHPPPSPPPPPPPYPVFPMPPSGFGNMMPVMPDHPPREAPYRPVGGFVPRPVVNDHRHSSRRGNFRPRGDGPYQNNFGGDVHMQPQRGPPRGFAPPPPNTAPFITPQTMRPFVNPMGFPDFVYVPSMPVDPFRGMPMMPHSPPPTMFVPVPETPLPAMLVHQIEFYFSDGNLSKDGFFKSKMDDHGWVPISLIAGFNRIYWIQRSPTDMPLGVLHYREPLRLLSVGVDFEVQQARSSAHDKPSSVKVKNMTNDINFILESLKISTVLEVKDDRVRRRGDWMKWIPTASPGLQSSNASSYDKLTNSLQKITVDEAADNQNSAGAESSGVSEDAQRRSSTELTTIHFEGPENTS